MFRTLLAFLALATAARAADVVARLAWVRGHVAVTRAGRQQPEDGRAGLELYRGDRVAASAGADAGLVLTAGGTHDLARLPGSRWTAGEAFEPPRDALKDLLLGKPATSAPAGPDFAHNGDAKPLPVEYAQPNPAKAPAAAVVMGAISPFEVKQVVARNQPRIVAVYQDALTRRPTLAGRVVVVFDVGPDGQVTAVKLDGSTTGAPDFDERLAQVCRTFRFPSAGNAVQFRYPFVFKP